MADCFLKEVRKDKRDGVNLSGWLSVIKMKRICGSEIWDLFSWVESSDELTVFMPNHEYVQCIFHLLDQFETCICIKRQLHQNWSHVDWLRSKQYSGIFGASMGRYCKSTWNSFFTCNETEQLQNNLRLIKSY